MNIFLSQLFQLDISVDGLSIGGAALVDITMKAVIVVALAPS